MALSDYSFVDLATVREDLLSQKISAIDLVEFYLNKAKTEDRFNAFLELFNSSALESAAALDKKINSGEAIGELAGAIIGLKDNLCFKDHKVGASSKILDGFTSLYTATAVQNLINQDAIILGRLNCDEFAMGSSNENSAYGVVKNPIDTSLVPGGSSGGSAASVAAGLCMASLGSDTGGSIRQPASFTGLVGLKPTYGRISRYGLIAFASSFDQIGPFTKSVDDSELLYKIMAGKDVMDSTSSIKPIHKERSGQSKFTFAYYEEVINSPGLHPKTKTLFLAGHK